MPDGVWPLRVTEGWMDDADAADAHTFAERLRSEGAEVLARHAVGDLAGLPAVTRHVLGAGAAWYLGAVVGTAVLSAVIDHALAAASVADALGAPAGILPDGLEAVRRGDVLFLLNHSAGAVDVPVPGSHQDLLSDERIEHRATVAAGEVRALQAIVRTDAPRITNEENR